jgi:hypothetical protein
MRRDRGAGARTMPTVGAGYIERYGEQMLLRIPGQVAG